MKVVLIFRESGSKTPCTWCSAIGIYIRSKKISTIDKLEDFIIYKDIAPIEEVLNKGKASINKDVLMFNKEQKVDSKITKLYNKINKSYYNYFDDDNENTNSVYANIREIFRMGDKYNDVQVCDMLIKSLFRNNAHSKKLLFMLYPNIIENNLLVNLKPKTRVCASCGSKFVPSNNRQKVCDDCREDYVKETDRARKKKNSV